MTQAEDLFALLIDSCCGSGSMSMLQMSAQGSCRRCAS